jgi:hypothetical protein
MSQLPLKIFQVSRASIDQYRAQLKDSVKAWIGALAAGHFQGFSDGSGLYCFLGDACCGPGPSPVMKGNGHHCVTLKHALRPYRGGLKASTRHELPR